MDQRKIIMLFAIAAGAYVLMKKTAAQTLATGQPVAYQPLPANQTQTSTSGFLGGLLGSLLTPGTNHTPGLSLPTAITQSTPTPSYTPDTAGEAEAAANMINNLDTWAVNPVTLPAFF